MNQLVAVKLESDQMSVQDISALTMQSDQGSWKDGSIVYHTSNRVIKNTDPHLEEGDKVKSDVVFVNINSI